MRCAENFFPRVIIILIIQYIGMGYGYGYMDYYDYIDSQNNYARRTTTIDDQEEEDEGEGHKKKRASKVQNEYRGCTVLRILYHHIPTQDVVVS